MGKHKYIETPEKMWELFKEYVEDVKKRPFLVKDWVGKDGDQVEREKEKPLTIEGFENYLFINGIISDLGDYLKDKDGRYTEYAPICRALKRFIRQDQIEGGMAGIYSTSITQRLNGLVDKTEDNGNKEVIVKVRYERKGNYSTGTASGSGAGDEGEEKV